MKYVGPLLLLLAISNVTSGCTENGGSQAGPGSKSPVADVPPVAGPNQIPPVAGSNQITPEEAQSLIKKVQEETANSQQYALTEQDANDLSAEGLIENDELKAWVK